MGHLKIVEPRKRPISSNELAQMLLKEEVNLNLYVCPSFHIFNHVCLMMFNLDFTARERIRGTNYCTLCIRESNQFSASLPRSHL